MLRTLLRIVKASNKTEFGYEGDNHVVSWAVGHMLGFVDPEQYEEKFKRWRLQDLPIVPQKFEQQPVRGAKKQLTALKRYLKAKDVETVVNACDAGREGELIFQEIYRLSGVNKPVSRLWLQSMTDKAIANSLDSLRDGAEFQGLADAADCRAESDWLIGINATRALTVRLRSSKDRNVWSAGRVQTATLSLLVGRELEILSHIPEAYWRRSREIQGTGAHVRGDLVRSVHQGRKSRSDSDGRASEADRENPRGNPRRYRD